MENEHLARGLWLTAGEEEPIAPFPGVELWTVNSDTAMLAIVRMAPGAVIPSHAHENEQTGGVIRGEMTFTIGDDTREVSPGQGYLIPPNVPHAATAGSDGCLVFEVFLPPRDGYRMPSKP